MLAGLHLGVSNGSCCLGSGACGGGVGVSRGIVVFVGAASGATLQKGRNVGHERACMLVVQPGRAHRPMLGYDAHGCVKVHPHHRSLSKAQQSCAAAELSRVVLTTSSSHASPSPSSDPIQPRDPLARPQPCVCIPNLTIRELRRLSEHEVVMLKVSLFCASSMNLRAWPL